MIYYNLKYKHPIKALNTFKDKKKNIEYGLAHYDEDKTEEEPASEPEIDTEKESSENTEKWLLNIFRF